MAGILMELLRLIVKSLNDAQKAALKARLYSTARPRGGFEHVPNWAETSSMVKIGKLFQWFLHNSWADLSGLLTPSHERLWYAPSPPHPLPLLRACPTAC